MNKRFYGACLFIFMINCVCAQNNYEFFGMIKLNDSSLITYKVHFEENNNSIDGFSITDLGGEHETKSMLKGKYDANTRLLTFREISIVYTKSEIIQDDFCMIHFTSDNFKLGPSEKLQGRFKGRFQDGEECIDGEIILTDMQKVNKNVTKITKKIERTKRISDSIKQKVNPIKMMDTLNMNILRENKLISVFSSSKSIDLILYDGGKEDGDRISLSVNGISLLDDYLISSGKKIIRIPLNEKRTRIELRALNVGSISTNTAVIELNDGHHKVRALTNLKAGKMTQIDILRK